MDRGIKGYFKDKFTKLSKSIGGSGSTEESPTQNVATSKSETKAKGKSPKEKATQVESQTLKQQHGNANSYGYSNSAANAYPIDQIALEAEDTDVDEVFQDSANGDSDGCVADEDMPGRHKGYKKHRGPQTQKASGWRTTTKKATEFTRGHTRRSKDSGFSGSFRKSGRNKKKKGDDRNESSLSDRLETVEHHSSENKDDESSNGMRPIKSMTGKKSQSDHTELEAMVKKRDRTFGETANGEATESRSSDSENGADDENLPIPLNLHRDLKRVLRAAKVQYYIIRHDPDNIYKISIDGCHVTRLQSRLKVVLRKSQQCSKFSIITKDIFLDFPEKTLPTLGLWNKQRSQLRCMLANSFGQRPSVIEFMMKGNDSRRRRLTAFDCFVATTAHSLLTPQECRLMMVRGINKKDWLKMTDECWREMPFMSVPEHSDIDITSRPFPVYRHWFRAGSIEEYSFLADLVVFKVDMTQLEQEEWLSRDSGLSSQYGRVVADRGDVQGENCLGIGTLWKGRRKADLLRLVGKRIACAGKTGKVVPTPQVEQNGWVMGLHLCFVLDHGQTLADGDCGSVVYLLGEEAHNEDTIVGMLFGTYVLDPRLHQAIVLSPVLKQLKAKKEFHIQDLLPLYSLKRPPSRTRPESGYNTSRASSILSLADQK